MAKHHRRAASSLAGVLVLVTLAACAPSEAAPSPDHHPVAETSAPPDPQPRQRPENVLLTTDRGRQSPGVVAAGGGDAPYNYGPTVMVENGRVRMWWCSQLGYALPPGDDLLHSSAASLDGPFSAPDGSRAVPVLSGTTTGFDGMHTCDPTVVKAGDTYYLYYTGAAGDHAHGNAIGVASSKDGISWSRMANGAPIITPAYDTARDNTYGSGQPAAVFLGGWFYLMFTDTTGAAAGWNGAGQFVLRSQDPTFRRGVQALGEQGFADVEATNKPRTRSVVDAFSADLMWIDALSAFAIAHETELGTTVTFWDRDFAGHPFQPVLIPGRWREGPGLVRTPNGHAPVSPQDPCGRIPLDVVRATVDGWANAPTDLTRFGVDLAGAPGCETEDEAGVLDGFAVPSPENTLDLVVDGELVRVERRSVAERLAKGVLDRRPAAVESMPLVGRVPSGVEAVGGPGGQVGLLVDDKLWLVGGDDVAKLNSSPITQVSGESWEEYAQAGNLRR
ncbi:MULTISPECIES: beta-xylosidase [Actinosynnema]|uniref:Beta-xylosidase n=1 Tax=Actinosynnema pretiosum TaxID=42197 RepID=A0A290ZBG6_9PSEU|nr:beta-xylosidase [Actinosynnema pretiosum]ATE56322.1 beta-xylosidase [Actinosynnema pretiosum]